MNVPTQDAHSPPAAPPPAALSQPTRSSPAVTLPVSLSLLLCVCLCCAAAAAVDTADQKSNCQSVCSPAAIEARSDSPALTEGCIQLDGRQRGKCFSPLNDLLNLFDFGIETRRERDSPTHTQTHPGIACYSCLPSLIRDPLR